MMKEIFKTGPSYGKVTDIADPDKQGRIKVSLPLMGEEVVTDWLPVLNLYGSSKGGGAFFLPEVEDLVIVAFMGNSLDRGIVLGSIWTKTQPPPETGENSGSDLNKDGKNNLKFIKSRSGHMIILDDKNGDEKIQLIAAGGKTRIDMSKKDNSIIMKTDGDLTINSKKNIILEAEKGELKFSGNLDIQAAGLILKSDKDIKMEGGSMVELKGAAVKLN